MKINLKIDGVLTGKMHFNTAGCYTNPSDLLTGHLRRYESGHMSLFACWGFCRESNSYTHFAIQVSHCNYMYIMYI